MPYTKPSEAPDYIPVARRKQWIEIFNSVYSKAIDGGKSKEDAEKSAFEQASGVVKREDASEPVIIPELTPANSKWEPATPHRALASDDDRISAEAAGYMELPGAVKDSDCAIVCVKDGVSSQKGCCNLYKPDKGASGFKCGSCIHLEAMKTELSERMSQLPFAVYLSVNAPITAVNGKSVTDVPICTTGTWVKGDHQFSITPSDLDQIIANFNKRKNDQVVIDFEHASEHPEIARGGPIPAAGWIHGLYQSGGRLIGQVEWTPDAHEMIKGGQYRFFSPAIDWGCKDKESGEPQGATLTSGALTNHPFLEELPPLMLSDADTFSVSISSLHIDKDISDEPGATPISVAYEQPPAQAEQEVLASKELNAKALAENEMADKLSLDKDHKSVGGESVPRDKFLYVGDPNEKDTWALPVHDEGHIRNALARFNQTSTIPADKKKEVAHKLVSLAKKHGIDTSGFQKAESHLFSEELMAKSTVKKIDDGKFAGRHGRYDKDGKLLSVMPSTMSDEEMAVYAAELDELDPVAGKAQPGPKNTAGGPSSDDGALEPAGAFLAETDEEDEPEPAPAPKTKKASKMAASEVELSTAEIFGMLTVPEGKPEAGRINLSEAARLVREGTLSADIVFHAQIAEQAVDKAIASKKFLPKVRTHLMRQALSDVAAFEAFAASQPRAIPSDRAFGVSAEAEEADPAEDLQRRVKTILSEQYGGDKSKYALALADATASDGGTLWRNYRRESAKSQSDDE